jgi:hypothetical protein
MRHSHYKRHTGPPRTPHLEQLALHATILALVITVVLIKAAG